MSLAADRSVPTSPIAAYNRRKGNVYGEDKYHATLVEDGSFPIKQDALPTVDLPTSPTPICSDPVPMPALLAAEELKR